MENLRCQGNGALGGGGFGLGKPEKLRERPAWYGGGVLGRSEPFILDKQNHLMVLIYNKKFINI